MTPSTLRLLRIAYSCLRLAISSGRGGSLARAFRNDHESVRLPNGSAYERPGTLVNCLEDFVPCNGEHRLATYSIPLKSVARGRLVEPAEIRSHAPTWTISTKGSDRLKQCEGPICPHREAA